MTARRRYLSLLAILCMNLPLLGQVSYAQDGSGTGAFRAGDYHTALAEFQRLRDAGDRSPRLTYNLAVTHYQLGNSAAAERLFRDLLSLPRWGEIACYNLGLVAMQRGDRVAARRWFDRVHREATDANLRVLAADQLRQLDTDLAAAPPRSAVLLSIGGGFDTNVIAFPDPFQDESSQGEDSFVEALGYAQGYLRGLRGAGVRVHGYGYTRRHTDLDFLDPSALGAGVTHEIPFGDWQVEYGIGVGHSLVGGDALTTDFSGRVGVERMIGETRFSATYRPQFHSAGSAFPELEGTAHRVEFNWQRRTGAYMWRTGYRFEFNDREDRTFEDEFFSYSPMKHRMLLEAGWRLLPDFMLVVGGSHELGRHRDANRMFDLDGEFLEEKRNTDRTDLWARGEYDLGERWRLSGEARHVSQDDTFSFYEYDRSTFSIGLEYVFQ